MANSDYILFLDESAETKANPYLLLGGIIISRNNYKKFLIPSIQNTKSILGNSNIVFHYTDILKKQKDFKILCSNADICTKFWTSLRNTINKTDLKIITAYTNVKEYLDEYPDFSHDIYEILFSSVINSYIHFLIKNKARGSIVFESREETQNRKIQKHYFNILQNGTNIYIPEAIDKYITTTSFTVKEENSIGLQIADIVAYNCVRYINGHKIQHSMWNILEPKIYDGYKANIHSYGLVKLF
jgi:hypothetical protein|nr:MAG TPA: Protein of unknown function (DUF3800) [Caudoviricetes sp.]DAZ74693.1 MAG TPA: Protein of unknown function (DUF3800) [Caudoviricetes sp.]